MVSSSWALNLCLPDFKSLRDNSLGWAREYVSTTLKNGTTVRNLSEIVLDDESVSSWMPSINVIAVILGSPEICRRSSWRSYDFISETGMSVIQVPRRRVGGVRVVAIGVAAAACEGVW